MKKDSSLIGYGKDIKDGSIKPIIDGTVIFELMDSLGFPLCIIRDILKDREMGFSIPEFIQAAKNSKNYNKDKLRAILIEDIKDDIVIEMIDYLIKKTYV